ncbi:MAG: chromate resistance protein, partial [Candidatus Hydrogenedentes bacterium]|nr:chromate resistance protein [Candidatus Hydrogenedentota bacterium]
MNRNRLQGIILLVAMAVVLCVVVRDSVRAEEKDAPVFSTWNGHLADADTCATAWLIKRFAAPDARFEFVPVGEMALPGTPFGVPQAELRVQRGKTTFEAALDQYELKSAPLLLMARIIRDIELNKWGE